MSTQWPGHRLWTFHADMNSDGVVTVSDVWLWLKWLWFYPGDWILLQYGPTKIGKFFELSPEDYGGRLSGSISFTLIALFVFMIVAMKNEYVYSQTAAGKAALAKRQAEAQVEAETEKKLNETRPWYAKAHSNWWVLGTYVVMGIIIYIVTLFT